MKPEIFKYISREERRHYMKCPDCGKYFDMRDLQDVFNHLHKSKALRAEYTHSVEVVDTITSAKK